MSDRIEVAAQVKVTDQATGPLNGIRGALAGLRGMATSVKSSFGGLGTLGSVGGAVRGLGSAMGRLGGMVRSVVAPMAALFGIAGGLGIAEAISGMETYVGVAKGLLPMARNLGTTVEHLNALHFAADRFGISSDSFNANMQRANINISRLASGEAPKLASLFKEIGISTTDANGKMRSSVDLLSEFADAIGRTSDPGMRGRMAAELFGRAAGPEMARMLAEGDAGLQKHIARAIELGVITEEQATAARTFAQTQRDVREVWASLSQEISSNLLPAIQPLIVAFRNLLVEHRPAIVEGLTSALTGLAAAVGQVDFEHLFTQARDWAVWGHNLVESIGGWKVALGALAVVMGGPTLVALGSILLAFGKLAIVLGALALTPVGAVITAIAAVAAGTVAIYQNWDRIAPWFAQQWGEVQAAFWTVVAWLGEFAGKFLPEPILRAWSDLAPVFSEQWGRVRTAFDGVATWFTGTFLPMFKPDAMRATWEGLPALFAGFMTATEGELGGALTFLGNFARAFVPQGIQDAWATFPAAIGAHLADAKAHFDWMLGAFGTWSGLFTPEDIERVWSAVPGFFERILAGITAAFSRAWAAIEPIIAAIRDAMGWITDNLPSLSGITEKLAGAGKAVFELPGRGVDAATDRVRGWLPTWAGGREAGAGQSIPQAAGTGLVGQATAAQGPQEVKSKVELDVKFANAPPGMTVATADRGGVKTTADVGHSMVPT